MRASSTAASSCVLRQADPVPARCPGLCAPAKWGKSSDRTEDCTEEAPRRSQGDWGHRGAEMGNQLAHAAQTTQSQFQVRCGDLPVGGVAVVVGLRRRRTSPALLLELQLSPRSPRFPPLPFAASRTLSETTGSSPPAHPPFHAKYLTSKICIHPR